MRLTDCFVELFAFVLYFLRNASQGQFSFAHVKANIHRLMSESEKQWVSASLSREDFDMARFAVCAWIDEAILESKWGERDRWLGEQLQRFYYQTSDAGEIFFERLNSLGPHQRDVREIYYLCLSMGFAGRYCRSGDEYLLDQLRISNLKLLTGSSVALPSLESSELIKGAHLGSRREYDPPPSKGFAAGFTMLCIGAPVVLLLGLFVIYRFILSNLGGNVLNMMP